MAAYKSLVYLLDKRDDVMHNEVRKYALHEVELHSVVYLQYKIECVCVFVCVCIHIIRDLI